MLGISIFGWISAIHSYMKFTVQTLRLNRAITVPEGTAAADGTKSIYEFRSLVKKNDLEPAEGDHLGPGKPVQVIPEGTYLFTQSPLTDEDPPYREAAEAVWLESLWLGAEFINDRILIRTLSEDSKSVFQIFREIRN